MVESEVGDSRNALRLSVEAAFCGFGLGVGVEETLQLNPPRAELSLIVELMLHGCTVYVDVEAGNM